MAFKEDIQDYKTFEDGELNYKYLSRDFYDELAPFISRYLDEENCQIIFDEIEKIVLIKQPYFKNSTDLSDYISSIKYKYGDDIAFIFDCLGAVVINSNCNANDINEFLNKHKIGYNCEYCGGMVNWYTVEKSTVINKIELVQEKVISISKQTYEELEMAKKLLENATDDRERKVAVRSALSALEALIKKLAKDEVLNDDYDDAMKKLVNIGKGNIKILRKDDLWSTLQNLYPDLRHGSIGDSHMPIEEAHYWIGKITNLSEYLIAIFKL